MDKLSRKIFKVLAVSLMGTLALAAVPFFHTSSKAHYESGATESVAYAEDVATVSIESEYSAEYGKWSGVPTGMVLGRIEVDGETVSELDIKPSYGNFWNAGDYTVYVTPEEGKTWESGTTEEKSFSLKVEKATLVWSHDNKKCEGLSHSCQYSANSDGDHITAEGVVQYDNNPAKIIIIKNGAVVAEARNAGEYKFTVEDAENYTNPTFTLTVTPLSYELGTGSTRLQWESLTTGYVYEYRYEDESGETLSAYLTSKSNSPLDSEWKNWRYVASDNEYKVRALHAYREGYTYCETKLENPKKAFTVEYVNDGNKGSALGKYTAVAKLTPSENYVFTYTEPLNKNMTVQLNSDGTATVEKEWYIAYYVNEFLDGIESVSRTNKTEYAFPEEWGFGSLPEGLAAPYVAHGDEMRAMSLIPDYSLPLQSSGYTLYANINPEDDNHVEILKFYRTDGAEDKEIIYNVELEDCEEWEKGDKDIVTFTLYKGETEICKDMPRSKFGYYVNDYMPVGDYKISFTVKSISYNTTHLTDNGGHRDWWSGTANDFCNSSYMGASVEYSFKVKAGVLALDESGLNFAANTELPHLGADLAAVKENPSALFDEARTKISSEGCVFKKDVKDSETYWATVADNYDYADGVLFAASADGENYFAENAADWAQIIAERNTYKLYYKISLVNYDMSDAVATAEGEEAEEAGKAENPYFIIDVYEVLEIPAPESVTLGYNGEEQTLALEEDERYTVTGDTQKEIGDYKATITLKDPVLTRWKDLEGAVCEVSYSITKGDMVWKEDFGSEGWKWNAFSTTKGAISGEPQEGTAKFIITTDEAGEEPVVGLETFVKTDGTFPEGVIATLNSLTVGDYYLWVSVDETANYKELAPKSVKFTVTLGDNGWKTAPTVQAWVAGGSANVPVAEPNFGTATIKVVADGNDNTVYYDSATSVNTLANLPVGRYIIIATVGGDSTKYSAMTARVAFGVCESEASTEWIIKPSIANYKAGDTPSAPKGMAVAEGSTIVYTYSGSNTTQAPAKAGNYTMTAVAYDKDGNEFARTTYNFTVESRMNGGTIALIVIIVILVLLLAGVLVFIIIIHKKGKGENGGHGGDTPEAPDGGNKPSEKEAPAEHGEPAEHTDHKEPVAPVEHREEPKPVEHKEPVKPVVPVAPAEHKEEPEPAEHEEPAAPVEPVEPVEEAAEEPAPQYEEPVQYAEPAPQYEEPVQYAEPAPQYEEPVQYAEPAPQYEDPAQYAQPAPQYEEPVQYAEPAPQYEEPVQYAEPAPQYEEPVQYADPAQYAQPAPQYEEPVQYADPAQYAQPAPQYEEPVQYADTAQYAQPAQYEEPVQYADPAQYAQPAQYEEPAPYEQPEPAAPSEPTEQPEAPAGEDEE